MRKEFMASFLDTLAEKAGVKPEQAKKGFDALLHAMQSRLPQETFASIAGLIPDVHGLPSISSEEFRDQLDIWGSSLNEAKGHAPRRDIAPLTQVLQGLSSAGFGTREAQTFLPVAFQLMKKHLPGHIMRQIERGIPGLSNLAPPNAGGLFDRLKNLI
jgi:hypothetical protein